MDKKTIGLKIKQMRIDKGFSQEKLSEAIDISPRQMCLIENGNSLPSLETFINIAHILDMDINEFFNINPGKTDEERIKVIDLVKTADKKKLPLIKDLLAAAIKHR